MILTEPQKKAIDTLDQNLQIVACAVSGKTMVVAQRVVNILAKRRGNGMGPENIVAFTFTDKAAAELKDRISRLYREQFGNVEGLAGMYVGTIHGFCLDLLQRYLFRYLKYDVLDEVRQRLLVDRNSRRSGMASLGLRRWIESGLYITILRVLREAEVDAHQITNEVLKQTLEDYQGLLRSHNYLDYDQMLLEAVVELQANPDLRNALGQRIKYLVVDEYQDVSPIQEMLIRTLTELGANLCVVGDDDQNIYQWRGSDVQHIVDFTSRYRNVVQVPLVVNFRSSPAIVEGARRLIEANHNRLPKEMKSAEKHDFARGDLLCLRFSDPQAEAKWIARKIESMRGLPFAEGESVRGLSWSDCAILLRSVRNSAKPVVAALKARNIPFIVTGMTGLFDTVEVQAAVGIFLFMNQDITAEQLKAIWLASGVGITEDDLGHGLNLLERRRTFDPGQRFGTYNLQRVYLDFLEAINLRQEQIPNGRGEVVYYNLGKFSQVISDFEEIHFKSKPEQKYATFVSFVRYQAPGYYAEGGQDAAYAVPDAVRVMTVHQAKGLEFPVVFMPCLQANRFPAKRQYNRIWNYIPRAAIQNAARYDGSAEDERRLFYVGMTRSEKYLFCSWAPDPSKKLYQRPSEFWTELSSREHFLTREPAGDQLPRIAPEPRRPLVNVELSFSDLKWFFECPYQFKLRLLYGFNPPLHEALGYGRSLHNALAEIHRRALAGEYLGADDIPALLSAHIYLRYAYPALEKSLRQSAEESLERYIREHAGELNRLEHAEEEVQLLLPEGIVVHGRIDLIKRADTGEVIIVDFKSVERAQPEDITRLQLHTYAIGYEQKFGRRADLIEVHNLDHGGSVRELVDDSLMSKTTLKIAEAGQRLRGNQLERISEWCDVCARCDLAGICRSRAPGAS